MRVPGETRNHGSATFLAIQLTGGVFPDGAQQTFTKAKIVRERISAGGAETVSEASRVRLTVLIEFN